MWMCIFLKMKKKIFIFKNIGMCVDRALTTAFLRGRQWSSFELKITTEYRKNKWHIHIGLVST